MKTTGCSRMAVGSRTHGRPPPSHCQNRARCQNRAEPAFLRPPPQADQRDGRHQRPAAVIRLLRRPLRRTLAGAQPWQLSILGNDSEGRPAVSATSAARSRKGRLEHPGAAASPPPSSARNALPSHIRCSRTTPEVGWPMARCDAFPGTLARRPKQKPRTRRRLICSTRSQMAIA